MSYNFNPIVDQALENYEKKINGSAKAAATDFVKFLTIAQDPTFLENKTEMSKEIIGRLMNITQNCMVLISKELNSIAGTLN